MPTPTFHRLPPARRELLVDEAITEFATRPFAEASLSDIARRTRIAKGSFYQYFGDKLDLYRWLLTDEVPRRKRAFLGATREPEGFWARLEAHVERGMAFLVEHPRLARLSAAAADPSATADVRGLHRAVCEAGLDELRDLLRDGMRAGDLAVPPRGLEMAVRFVATVIGPGLTDVVLQELGGDLHEVLASDALRSRLDATRRRRLARDTVAFLRRGLGAAAAPPRPTPARRKTSRP